MLPKKNIRNPKPAHKTTWREKLHRVHPSHGKVVPVPHKMRRTLGTGTLLIPRPLDVEKIIRAIPRGRLLTLNSLRAMLASRAGADAACPLCTGIFARIVAEAAEEDSAAGKSRLTPYWRLLRNDGSLFPKFPGGQRSQAARLRREGFTIVRNKSGSLFRVRDFHDALLRPSPRAPASDRSRQ